MKKNNTLSLRKRLLLSGHGLLLFKKFKTNPIRTLWDTQ